MRRSVDGHPIEVDIVGDGRPVLMLPGFPLDRRSLMRSIEPVFERRPGYRRIHVDLPGFGASPAVPAITSSAAMVDFVCRIIDDVAGDEAILIVGESWGAYLVRGVIAQRPARVAGVALLVPLIIAPAAERDRPTHLVLHEEPDVLAGVPEETAAAFRSVGVIVDAPAWSYFRDVVLPALGAGDAASIRAIAAGYAFPTDVDGSGDPYPGPALVVTGRQDSVVGYRDAMAILERFPRATFAVLDAAGHNVSGERPALLEALLSDWLDRVERT